MPAEVRTADRGAAKVEARFSAMNTEVHALIVEGSVDDLERAQAMIHDLERRWSRFEADSEVSLINRNPGTPVVVSPDTFDLITEAIDAFRLSSGIFDPTIHNSMVAAGYAVTFDDIEPGGVAIHEPAPGPGAIELHPTTGAVIVPEGVAIDLGGIGKGAAADLVAEAMMAIGAAGCMINIGGDIRFCGQSPDREGWSVTLACPGASTQHVVVLSDGAVCTSTTTKRQWRSSLDVEHHLREPTTGAALNTGLITASIVAARARQAEVLAKVALHAGVDRAGEAIAAHGATGIVVDSQGTVHELPALDQFRRRPHLVAGR